MPTHTLVVSGVDALLDALPMEPATIRSHRLLKASGVRLVGIAMDAGEILKEHVATAPILIQTLSGRVIVEINGDRVDLPEGAVVHIEANIRHSVEAVGEARIILTVLMGAEAARPRKRPAGTRASASTAIGRASAQLVLASSGTDSSAINAVAHRYSQLSNALATHSAHLLLAITSGDQRLFRTARSTLLDWCRDRLTPFLAAEASVLYPPLGELDNGFALAELLAEEQAQIIATIDALGSNPSAPASGTATVSLRVTVGHHLRTQTERLLPALAASPLHELAELWARVELATGLPSSRLEFETTAS